MNQGCIATIINKIDIGTKTTDAPPEDCKECYNCPIFTNPNAIFPNAWIKKESKGKKKCEDITYSITVYYSQINLCDECAKWTYGTYSYSTTKRTCGECDTSDPCPGQSMWLGEC